MKQLPVAVDLVCAQHFRQIPLKKPKTQRPVALLSLFAFATSVIESVEAPHRKKFCVETVAAPHRTSRPLEQLHQWLPILALLNSQSLYHPCYVTFATETASAPFYELSFRQTSS